jgi:dTDP-4-dehydrorhamnose reductase
VRILLTGASGQLGSYLLREIVQSGLPVVAWSGSRTGRHFGVELIPVDLADSEQLRTAFRRARPTIVIHAAAMATVAECCRDQERAQQVNTRATAVLAELAEQATARILFVSTDLVFDGEKGSYREEDAPSPLSVYARTKVAAEKPVLAVRQGIVVRVSLLFGPSMGTFQTCPTGHPSFFDQQVKALREGRSLTLFSDEWRTPLDLNTASRALLAIARSERLGMLHLGGPERMSRLEMGQRLAAYLGLDPSPIVAVGRSSVPAAEPRPRDTSLDSSRWRESFPVQPWPSWKEALTAMAIQKP